MLKVKGVYPPSCDPTITSLTQISVFQSTAPKCRRIFLAFQSAGTSKAVRYQSSFFAPTSFITPDKLDSAGKGTKILPSNFSGRDFPRDCMAYSHNPFRFFQSGRSMIGRGYSGSTFSGSIFCAHSVFILFPAGFHWAVIGMLTTTSSKKIRNLVGLILVALIKVVSR